MEGLLERHFVLHMYTGTDDGTNNEKEIIEKRLSWAGHVAHMEKKQTFLIPNFRRVLNVVCFLLGNSPASEFLCRRFGTLCSIFIG